MVAYRFCRRIHDPVSHMNQVWLCTRKASDVVAAEESVAPCALPAGDAVYIVAIVLFFVDFAGPHAKARTPPDKPVSNYMATMGGGGASSGAHP